ncbi:LysR family transcriptional regulator [Roseomonas gilardii]|uniref:LysR family transcriptional regulator n=1 Tax=Roseomonas gilardii TaxID=257708 RepID=UPI001F01A224|nr:LysR family transcriptional regulator [Roseomonas gilardii]
MTLAAEELHITHGAVSRHIKTPAQHLGVPLFRRLTRRIVLTDEGAEFLVAVTRLLADLTREAECVRAQNRVTRLTISTGLSFASKWLAPRLHRLKARHPEFEHPPRRHRPQRRPERRPGCRGLALRQRALSARPGGANAGRDADTGLQPRLSG